ncbi:MAG TPA: M48 family metallopeptidase [Burkholderiales bacterium]|jgi:beta-barrel assembly-enhancing protease|nr:M48 family metallopeptidase [Burkholderiales bacterium]
MKLTLFMAALAATGMAHAQFRMPNFDLNKAVESVKNVNKAVREPSEAEEISIGRDVASRLLGAAPLVDDPAMQRYVNHVGRWLALQTERPDLPWQFGVLESPNLNAFAMPGGTIFITRGLLQRMRSEAELGGVLGHEIAHVLRKHHLKAIQKGAQTALAGDALSAALRERAGASRDKLIAFGAEMYSRGLDKSDELEADRLGVVIAARAGYDSYGLPAVLQTLQAMNPQDSGLALMFKTHPAPGERLDALSERMQPVLDAYAGQAQLADRFVRQLRK